METTLHTDVHGWVTDFSFSWHKNARNKSIRGSSVIIHVKRNLRLRDTTENHGDTLHTDVHGWVKIFSFQTKKLVTKSSVTQSVIIRVKLNLRLRDTTEIHGDNASHGCPRMSHGFFITRPIFGPTDQREVIINYRIHFSHGCSRIPSATRCLYRSARKWLILWHVLISLCHSPQTFCLYFSTQLSLFMSTCRAGMLPSL